jgi:hypothetical protein
MRRAPARPGAAPYAQVAVSHKSVRKSRSQ